MGNLLRCRFPAPSSQNLSWSEVQSRKLHSNPLLSPWTLARGSPQNHSEKCWPLHKNMVDRDDQSPKYNSGKKTAFPPVGLYLFLAKIIYKPLLTQRTTSLNTAY